MKPISLHSKLVKVYILQFALISTTTLLSVVIAAYVLEHLLIHNALKQEAEHYWSLSTSTDTPHALPNTRNLRGFLNDTALPVELRNLSLGFGRIQWQGQQAIYYASDFSSQRLYLIFLQKNVLKLAFYFGILPLSLLLLIFYIFMWFSYQQSRRALSPLTQLAKRVSEYKFSEKNLPDMKLQDLRDQADLEVLSLMNALEQFNKKIFDHIERERNFTRDASHELRTPLALLQASLDVIEQDAKQHPVPIKTQQHLQKIQITTNNMLALLEALLLLARDHDQQLATKKIDLVPIITEWKQHHQQEISQKNITFQLIKEADITLNAPPFVAQIVLENLLNNALKYTHTGRIDVFVQSHQINIKDTGEGINIDDLPHIFSPFYRGLNEHENIPKISGFGLGLSIVKRICDQQGWQILIASEIGIGTQATLIFPQL
jgi:signal transduction histidine kinase